MIIKYSKCKFPFSPFHCNFIGNVLLNLSYEKLILLGSFVSGEGDVCECWAEYPCYHEGLL